MYKNALSFKASEARILAAWLKYSGVFVEGDRRVRMLTFSS